MTIRARIARRLHSVGLHWACRERRVPFDVTPMVLPDGTTWKPDLNGFMPFYRVHE